jgi:hypothetical protein
LASALEARAGLLDPKVRSIVRGLAAPALMADAA